MKGFKFAQLGAALTLGMGIVLPAAMTTQASAQRRKHIERKIEHRQKTKNDWRNIGIGSGALGVLGLLTGNKTLAALGIGGGLYSATRYEADRKSQKKDEQRRYELFHRSSFDHDGHHYVRKTKYVKGKKYYYFVKSH